MPKPCKQMLAACIATGMGAVFDWRVKQLATLFVSITTLAQAGVIGLRHDGTGVFPACFELNGQRLWIRDCGAPDGQGLEAAAPCLADGVLVVFSRSSRSQVTGYDAASGQATTLSWLGRSTSPHCPETVAHAAPAGRRVAVESEFLPIGGIGFRLDSVEKFRQR